MPILGYLLYGAAAAAAGALGLYAITREPAAPLSSMPENGFAVNVDTKAVMAVAAAGALAALALKGKA